MGLGYSVLMTLGSGFRGKGLGLKVSGLGFHWAQRVTPTCIMRIL